MTIGLLLGALPVVAQSVTEEMVSAAGRFLGALSPEQRAKAVYPLDSRERLDWHYVPRSRGGLPFREMRSAQRHLAMGLLGTALSQRGLLQATTIMSLEAVLAELEGGRGPERDAELYYLSIFGEPTRGGAWGWRFEGHHLSLHFLLVEGEVVSVTPSFWGANPGEVREGPRRGLRATSEEEDQGRALMNSFSAGQKDKALVATNAPGDIMLSPSRAAELLLPAGLPAAEMGVEQVTALRRLVRHYVYRCRSELADEEIARIENAGFERVLFAWAGAIEPGRGHYYRIQGPTFVVEYDNTQNEANHVHTVWRDLSRDFGADILAEHYRLHPHPGDNR